VKIFKEMYQQGVRLFISRSTQPSTIVLSSLRNPMHKNYYRPLMLRVYNVKAVRYSLLSQNLCSIFLGEKYTPQL